jgi:hypothetical protein
MGYFVPRTLRVLTSSVWRHRSYVIKEEGYVIKVKKHEEGSKTKVVLKFTFEVRTAQCPLLRFGVGSRFPVKTMPISHTAS